jgi:WD40 repeat protein
VAAEPPAQRHRHWVNTIAVLPDGRRVLSGSDDKTLRLWDIDRGAELRRFEGHDDRVNAIVVLPDGRRALSGSDDRTLPLWDIESGTHLAIFTSDRAILAISIAKDEARVVIGVHVGA